MSQVRPRSPQAPAIHASQTDACEASSPDPSPRARSRRRPVLPFLLGLVVGCGMGGLLAQPLGSALAALGRGSSNLGAMIDPNAIGRRSILVMGTDQVGDNTDVMFTVQVRDGSTTITQVPRDTFIESEEHGVLKANSLYALAGMEATKDQLTRLLANPVDRHIKVNLQAVEKVAEALGGVEIDVPKRMYYVDSRQDLYIDLYPGPQVLKGAELEGFVRFRNDEMGDIGRMERQKMVLEAIFAKLSQPAIIAQLPSLLRIAGDDVDTDLSPIEFGQLINAMTTTKLTATQLPGRLFWHEDLSYWMPDSNEHYPAHSASHSEEDLPQTF